MSALAPGTRSGWHPVAVVFDGRQADRKAHLYIIPIILNICIFPGFFLLFFPCFCIQGTPITGNRMIIYYLFRFFLVFFLLHSLEVCNLHEYGGFIFSSQRRKHLIRFSKIPSLLRNVSKVFLSTLFPSAIWAVSSFGLPVFVGVVPPDR